MMVLFPQRVRRAYRAKMVTDMSFRATIIAMKVVLLTAAIAAALAFVYAEKTSEPGAPTPAQSFLGTEFGDS
jgi:hypothetical protein